VETTSPTNPTDASATQGPDGSQPAEASSAEQPGFRSRGRARRRARFLRRARELAYRDLGGLVYNLHRFGQRNDPLVLAKLNTLSLIDGELRTIEAALDERRALTVLREAGITACPRCAAIHGSEDRFCPNCGLPMSKHPDLPIAQPAGVPPQGQPAAPAQQPSPAHPEPAAQPPAAAQAGAPAMSAPESAAPASPRREPATAASEPARAPAPSGPPPAPAAPAPEAPASPQRERAASPAAGRAPSPPSRTAAADDGPAVGAHSSGPDEVTEIIRPPAPGS
jgi:hypothetical protein